MHAPICESRVADDQPSLAFKTIEARIGARRETRSSLRWRIGIGSRLNLPDRHRGLPTVAGKQPAVRDALNDIDFEEEDA
jgi:hypothetical protein